MTELKTISEVKNPILDVVFVHGLGGNYRDSWSSDAGYWPQWVSESNPSIRVSSVDYPYRLSLFRRSSLTIREHATALMELFVVNDIGTRPVLFIAHSMGGVVVKELLRQSESSAKDYHNLWENTVAAVFLATPTAFSSIARSKLFIGLYGGPLVDTAVLSDLNAFYRERAPRKGITTLSFAAASDIISNNGADPGVPDAVVIPIDVSNYLIGRPTSRSSLVVASVQRLIKNIQDLIRENRITSGSIKND